MENKKQMVRQLTDYDDLTKTIGICNRAFDTEYAESYERTLKDDSDIMVYGISDMANNLTGFACYIMRRDQSALLSLIGIEPDNQRDKDKHYGSILLSESISMLSESDNISVVRARCAFNTRDFYTRNGFHQEKDEYGRPQMASGYYCLEKRLPR